MGEGDQEELAYISMRVRNEKALLRILPLPAQYASLLRPTGYGLNRFKNPKQNCSSRNEPESIPLFSIDQ